VYRQQLLGISNSVSNGLFKETKSENRDMINERYKERANMHETG
jgi:hypothetical protein